MTRSNLSLVQEAIEIQRRCSCCGGRLPEEGSPAWNHPTRRDGYCPGSLATDALGLVIGCGGFNWAYRPTIAQPRDERGRFC